MKKNCKELVKKKLEQKKYLKEKMIDYMSNGKGMIIVFNSWIEKKDLIKK